MPPDAVTALFDREFPVERAQKEISFGNTAMLMGS